METAHDNRLLHFIYPIAPKSPRLSNVFSFFSRLIKGRIGIDISDFGKRTETFDIDVSGPEFIDLVPSKDDITDRLRSSGLFQPDKLKWVVDTIYPFVSDPGAGLRKKLQAVIRAGSPLSKEEKKALGINPNRIVGQDFVNALQSKDINEAIKRLDVIIHTATATANKLHNLRRMEEIGVTHVAFSSSKDERNTDIENRLEGNRFTISEAKRLIADHEEDIRRSVFIGDVNF